MDKQSIRAELEKHLTTLDVVQAKARVHLCIHPETKAKLYLPHGYDIQHQTIVRLTAQGNPQPLYSGLILALEIGVDVSSNTQTVTIGWKGSKTKTNQLATITIDRADLVDQKSFARQLGGVGAAIHPRNARDVSTLLVEFVQENDEELPRRRHSQQLGLVNNSTIILPAKSIGATEPIRYTGRQITIGKDYDIYPDTIRDILTWSDASSLLLLLALSLAAPAIARIRPRRNPNVFSSGGTGLGKTTTNLFATGIYGPPTSLPFKLETFRTTSASFFQTLGELNGLPLFIDEAHTVGNPTNLEGWCYQFANGQRYSIGTPEQRVKGGTDLAGVVFLAGEAIPTFRNAGANKRMLWLDGNEHLPLGIGAEAGSLLGKQRATMLEKAWLAGAGTFGEVFVEALWQDWAAFLVDVEQFKQDPDLAAVHTWTESLAIAAAALKRMGALVDPSRDLSCGFADWRAILETGQNDADPHTQAFAGLVTMLQQANDGNRSIVSQLSPGAQNPSQWDERWLEGKLVACKLKTESEWRVLSTTPQITAYTGSSEVARRHGKAWVERQWVKLAQRGNRTISTHYVAVSTGGKQSVFLIPDDVLDKWGE
jgi:hypothetical protein